MYQIAVRVLASGERALFLLDGQRCPPFYPTLFVTSQLRNVDGAFAKTFHVLNEPGISDSLHGVVQYMSSALSK
ncbi:hypothetical protein [Luteibacter yeojuensis]